MRFETFVRWVVSLAVLGWAGYTVADAGSTYFVIDGIVDKALTEGSARYRTSLASGTQPAAVVRHVRNSIVAAAHHDGLPVEPGNITVLASKAEISVTVQASFPVIRYGGSQLLVVPISVHRSVIPAP